MTFPRTIACVPSPLEKDLNDTPLQVFWSDSKTQDIFRPAAPRQQNKAHWYLPIYRNISLLSSSSRDTRSSFSFESTSTTDENKAYDLPDAFVPPRHSFRSSSSSSSSFSDVSSSRANRKQLRPDDIVCGRGAPTSFHHGNHMFRDLVKNYETSYMCAKRSDKPGIAMELLGIVRACGGRFVRKDKVAGQSGWVAIGEHRAYEKVCQALREGAPELRRKMLSVCLKSKQQTITLLERMDSRDEVNCSPIPCCF